MKCILRQFLIVAIIIIVIAEFRAVKCEKKSQLQLNFDTALKERVVSVPNTLSIQCQQDFSLFLHQLEEGATWALNMMDSSGKVESGVLKGGHTFFGFYSQCMEALTGNGALLDIADKSTVDLDFSSKYCLSTLRLVSQLHEISKTQMTAFCDQLRGVQLTFAVCVPSTCNEDDVGKIAALYLQESGCSANVTSTTCQRPIAPFSEDWRAIVVTFFLSIVGAIILAATVYDSKRMNSVHQKENTPDGISAPENKNYVPPIRPPEQKRSNVAEDALLCFSLLQNGKKLFESDHPQSGSIRVLHGLRFFSMAWVILIHNAITAVAFTLLHDEGAPYVKTVLTEIAMRGGLAVDTFFFIGGLVLSYSTLKQLQKTGGKKNWILFYAHRYLRTVPMLMVVVAICAFLMRHLGDGPRWPEILTTYEARCRVSWWTYLLYVQNFVLTDQQCLPHTWYSAADFQIYLVSPLILYPLYKKPRLGVLIIAVLSIVSITASATYASLMTMRFTDKDFDYFRDVYNKTYFRMSPYLLGMLMGFFLNQRQKTLCPPRKLYVYLGWMLCAFCLLFSIFGYWICDPKLPTPWNGTIWPLSSIVWSVGIAWIVYACLAGCGGKCKYRKQ
ncbi:nose resistant to fluoxetine protein 6-like [Haemaphysalis longicornis]